MPTYKLTYFNIRGKAEVIRCLLALADVEYEDVRLTKEEWGALKPSTPFGQMPLLETEGVTLCQTKAIARYISRKHGLAGKSDLDQARVDMIVDCVDDMMEHVKKVFFGESDEIKAAARKKAEEEAVPKCMANLEKLLKLNQDGDAYFVGDEITTADVAFVDACGWLDFAKLAVPIENTPKLKALKEKFLKNSKIAAWIAKRPVTDM